VVNGNDRPSQEREGQIEYLGSDGKRWRRPSGTGLSFRSFGAAVCTHTFTRISETIPAVDSTCP